MNEVISISTRKPLEENIIAAQAEYAIMERDFAADRDLLARMIFRDELKHYRFAIGADLHENFDSSHRCAMCDGRFPRRGEAYAVWLPKSMGGECKPMHLMCFLGVSSWIAD